MANCSNNCKVRGFFVKDLSRKHDLVNAGKNGGLALTFEWDETEPKGALCYVYPSGTPYTLRTPSWMTATGRGCIASRCPEGTFCRWGQIDFAVTPNETDHKPRSGSVEVICAESGEVAASFTIMQYGNPAMKPEEPVAVSCESLLEDCQQERDDLQEQLDHANVIMGEMA